MTLSPDSLRVPGLLASEPQDPSIPLRSLSAARRSQQWHPSSLRLPFRGPSTAHRNGSDGQVLPHVVLLLSPAPPSGQGSQYKAPQSGIPQSVPRFRLFACTDPAAPGASLRSTP